MPFISAGDGDLKSAFITDAWLIDQFVGNRLYLWGINLNGQLADNTVITRSYPIQSVSGGVNWKQVAGGYSSSCGIKTDGTLWTWGNNTSGKLGDNTTTNKSSPVQTVTGGTTWSQVSCGKAHTAAVKTDGTLWAWGNNAFGKLGDSTTTNKSSPVQTIAAGNNWKQVSCGSLHTAAIKTDGTLWSWGYNYYGRLGDNTINDTSSPVQTVTGGTIWSSVACGYYHTAAIKTDGTLWVWGNNDFGQLGNNTVVPKSSPIQIGMQKNWSKIACGYYNTAAIKTDGTLWIWGINSEGQLGDNTKTHRSSPVQTIAGGNNWKQVADGLALHTQAIKNDGTLWVWGKNSYGRLGDNTTTHRSSPVQTAASGSNWKQVTCGYRSSMAITYGD